MSRASRPKQLLPLVGGRSLLELAVERLSPVFGDENILVITNAEYASQVRQCVPSLREENVIGEPEGRDTANAIALGAQVLAGRDESATMAVFTADHVIRPQDQFQRAVELACQGAENHRTGLVTFGVRPTWPHTGLGYVKISPGSDGPVHPVEGFREKPDHQTAREYVDSGNYFWNSGMFVWTVEAINAALGEFLPESLAKLAPIGQAVADGEDYRPILREVYPTLEKISIDFAVMERAREVYMVELDCEWVDVGAWPALEQVGRLDDSGNVVQAERSLLVDSARNVIVSEGNHLLAVVGVDDCIVVHTPDATIVCNKTDAQRIKDVVGQVQETFGDDVL
jgi:mannose-1-phosphate guanylyltransferase